jgi:FkbM family methyltransferase
MQIKHRPGTQDIHVWRGVLVHNEYRLPDAFQLQDRIIDIGAHIGVFATACLARGAGRVECYEPDKENYALLVENLKGQPACAYNVAVFTPGPPMSFSGYERGFNACGYMKPPNGDNLVATHGIDQVINNLPVRLLKLDCEGAEYPILLTATQLHLVEEIVGEVHSLTYELPDRNVTSMDLMDFLKDVGFRVTMWKPLNKGRCSVANFSARR